MNIMGYIKKHSIKLYFILSFLLSWGMVILLAGYRNIPINPENSKNILPLLYMSMLLGPSISGVLFIVFCDGLDGLKKLLRSMINIKVNFFWYLLAIFSAPCIAGVILWALSFFSADFYISFFKSEHPMNIIINGIAAGIFVGIFEEIGWSGFVSNKLSIKYNILKIGLSVGLLWGAWHFILFWENNSFSSLTSFVILILRLFTWLIPYRIFMIMIYKKTNSLLLTILSHISLVFTVTSIVPMSLTGNSLISWLLSWSIFIWIFVIILKIFVFKGEKGKISNS